MNLPALRHGNSSHAYKPLRRAVTDRIGIGHALVDNCSREEACDAIVSHAKSGGKPVFVATANAQHIVLLDQDKRLREIYGRADLVVPDGYSLLLAARFYGRVLEERITGVDMLQALCNLAAEHGLHVFLMGGLPESATQAAQVLKRRMKSLRISTYCPPFGFEKSPEGLEAAASAIRAAKPDLLFVALGAPKQEHWIYDHGLQLSVPVLMGVGGSFELIAGVVPRAPLWMQNLGCEWLYRLYREPRRMWRRYLVGNLEFGLIVIRQRLRRIILNAFFSFVSRDSFAAEIHEPGLQSRGKLFANVIRFGSRDIAEPHPSDVWVEP